MGQLVMGSPQMATKPQQCSAVWRDIEDHCSDVQVSVQETLTAAAGAQARHNSSNKEAAGARTVRL